MRPISRRRQLRRLQIGMMPSILRQKTCHLDHINQISHLSTRTGIARRKVLKMGLSQTFPDQYASCVRRRHDLTSGYGLDFQIAKFLPMVGFKQAPQSAISLRIVRGKTLRQALTWRASKKERRPGERRFRRRASIIFTLRLRGGGV
jgi:hypothetical protein